ncbi:5'-methylthioadenosine/S-adenosylhomocysteine nucleosidase [Saccharothrix hoggarensis]|uniref:5'-methylthioadenosine/S-adenosylhomocysteine nucleosidase n=1 Tax=Saccharothrix hoggarensis TaxID=913853 RepID=A0ABW3QW62_9PSEU
MFVILTALNIEHQAVFEHLTDVHERTCSGTLFEVGTLATRPDRQVALGVTGAGTTTAATLTERARTEFSPTAMLFVGVAGGLRDWLEIGDVVAATKVYSHHGARSEDAGDLARPRSWDASHALEQRARRLPRGDAWYSYLPDGGEHVRPGVHFDPIAAGDVLLNSRTSSLAQALRTNYNDAVAIEMESSGFAHAAHLSGNVPTMTIRGISDHADGNKAASDRAGTQLLAARNAAAFAIALIAALDDASGQEGRGPTPAAGPSMPTIHNTNSASGNARVGQQVGVQLGDYFRSGWTGGKR